MRTRFLAPALLAAALAAPGGEAPKAPGIDVAIADGAQLVKHWDASIYAKVWADPALAPLRAEFAKGIEEARQELGFDPVEALAALRSARMQFLGLQAAAGIKEPQPRLLAQADLGVFTAKIMPLILAKAGKNLAPTKVAGADEAYAAVNAPFPVVLARYGTSLVLALSETAAAPQAVPPQASDLHAVLDLKPFFDDIRAILPPAQAEELAANLESVQQYLEKPIIFDSTIVPEGMHDRLVVGYHQPGTKIVDRTVLGRLPANTLLALGTGFDGKAYWKELSTVLGRSMANGLAASGQAKPTPDEALAQIDGFLAMAGFPLKIGDIISSIDGTIVMAVTQGMPFPGVSIALPRSPQVDQSVAFLLGQIQVPVPAEGQSALIPLPPMVPIALSLIADKGHWLLTTDAFLGDSWTKGQPGGWADSPAGKTALAAAPAAATQIGSSDTPSLLRTVAALLAMAPIPDPKVKNSLMQGLAKAASLAATGWINAAPEGSGDRLELRGIIGLGAFPAIIAAIAIPNLLESRVTANESAASATLKSGIFPAQIQFQGGAYFDADGDNIGEYGLLSELSGRRPTAVVEVGKLRLLQGPAASGHGSGYHYAIYLPDGAGGAIGEPDGDAPRPVIKTAADAQERNWVAYAWPDSSDTGRRVFAILADGQVRSQTYTGEPPVWNSVFGGGNWEDAPVWMVYASGRPQPMEFDELPMIESRPLATPPAIP